MNKIASRPSQPLARPTSSPVIMVPAFEKPTFEGDPSESVIHPHFHGFNLITGFRGKGKSTLAMSWDNPNNIIMLDFENKEESGAKDLGINAYFPIMKEVIGKMGTMFDGEKVYDRTLQIIEAIPEGRFTTLVIDNAHEFQDSCCRKIENSPELIRRFGLKQKNVEMGSYGGALPGAKRLIANMLRLASSKGLKVISTTFQLKPAWQNNQPAFNKWNTTNVSIWHEESKLTLVMVDPMPEYHPIPRALVMKENLPLRKWDTELKRTITTRRIPMAVPRAEPFYIYEYLDKPASFENPQPGETVTASEIGPFSPTFSKEQLADWERVLRLQKELGMAGGDENE